MSKCKQCGVPLDGPLSIIGKVMGVKRSATNPELCNKCADKIKSETSSNNSSTDTETPESIVPRPEELEGTEGTNEVMDNG